MLQFTPASDKAMVTAATEKKGRKINHTSLLFFNDHFPIRRFVQQVEANVTLVPEHLKITKLFSELQVFYEELIEVVGQNRAAFHPRPGQALM